MRSALWQDVETEEWPLLVEPSMPWCELSEGVTERRHQPSDRQTGRSTGTQT